MLDTKFMTQAADLKLSDLQGILDRLDALVYVSDIDSHELLFMNQYGLKNIGGVNELEAVRGQPCYKVLQKGQDKPCDFCTNPVLPSNGDTYVWEFKNTRNHRWYQCRDRIIEWHDGRRVRLEVAVDISERKETEEELQRAQAQLKAQAETDGLTQLYNRRAFLHYAEQLRSSLPSNTYIGLVMLDIDYFKQINDNYGHEAGDELLQAIGKTLGRFASDTTIIARMGGEEFAVAFTTPNQAQAKQVAQQLQQAIAQLRVDYMDDTLSCTCSQGLAFGLASGELKTLIRQADRALYQAKSDGRAQTVMAAAL